MDRLATGKGGTLLITGEAGLGKSRLAEEIKEYAGCRDIKWLEGKCVSYSHSIGYWVFVEENTDIEIAGVPTDPTGSLDVPLVSGWNLVGNPFDADLAWGDNIVFVSDEDEKTLADAVAAGWMSGDALGYDQVDGYHAINANDSVAAWSGFFVKANRPLVLRLAH